MLLNLSCMNNKDEVTVENPHAKVLFLHHSTGMYVWKGSKLNKNWVLNKQNYDVPRQIIDYNKTSDSKIAIKQSYFPKGQPYPWENYPYDYYNIWVKNAGNKTFMEEPTLEMLTQDYDVIIFKFCFPVSSILDGDTVGDIDSKQKTLANYKLQMNAIKEKLNGFPGTKFLVWTGAALLEAHTNEAEANRAIKFADWMIYNWDTPSDNIEVFDFRKISTDGGLYLKPEYAAGPNDSHPNQEFAQIAAKAFVEKIIKLSVE